MIRRHRSYATFLDAMLAQLSSPYLSISGERSTLNPLAELDDSTRIGPAQALLEAWAMVGDVLTFYQDRVAAESALSTAREEFSAYAIARLVGYEPRPIISASTWLAFSVSALSGEKPTVTVPRGTAIGNVPSPGKLPAVFETSRDLEADPAWNLVPHALDEVPVRAKLARGATRVVLEGTAPIVPGTALALRVRRAREAAVRLVGAVVAETTVERARDATLLRWQTTTAAEGGEEIVEVLVLDVRVRPFGALAPPFAQAPPNERRAYALGGLAVRTNGAWGAPAIGFDASPVALAVTSSGVFAITATQLWRRPWGEPWTASSPFGGAPLQTIVATSDGRLAVGTALGGVFISIDDGRTWLAIGDGSTGASGKLGKYQTRKLPLLPIRAIAIDEAAEVPTVYVATDRGIASIALNGDAWTWRNDGLPGTDPKTGFASAAATSVTFADAEGTLLAATTYGVYRSTRAERWTRVQGLGAVSQAASLPGALVAAGPGGVFRSTDGGATWVKVREIPGLARVVSANIATVAVAVGNDVWTSDDGGATWVLAANVAGASIVALGVGADGTVAACAPLVENPAPDWPDLGTMIEGNALTLDRDLVLVAGDVIVVSREDDDSLAEAYTVVATKTGMLARFGTVGMTTTVIVDRRVNPLLGDVRRAVIHAGARVRAVVPVKREAPPAPRFALTVPRGLPKLEPKRRIAIEGRPARLLLRGTAGGTLRIVTSPTMAKDPVLPYAWPSPSPQSIEPDGDVTAVVRAGARGVVLARFDGVWRRDDVTDANVAWEHLGAPPVAVTGIALRGETIYACGLAPNNDLRTSGVYAFANGAWSEKPLLAGPVERVFVTGDGTLWACRERGLFAETDGTWHAVDALLDGREVREIAADAGTVLAACDDGVYARQGGAWTRVDGLRALSIASVALGNGFWYAGTHGAGVWRRKASGGAWEPLERARRTGDVRALLVCDDGTVLAAERGLGISANAVPLAAPLASHVRAFIPVAGEQGAFVLAFAGVPLSAGASAGTAPVPMRSHVDALDVLDAEAQTLDAGMLPASLRARLEGICGVKLELAEVVVEHAGRAWRFQVSEAVPVYLLRRGPLDAGTGALRADLFEVARFELLAPPVPYDGSAPAVIPDDAVCRWPVRGTDERPAAPLIARTNDVWYASARADAAPRAEIASVASHDGGEVALRDPLRYAYDPATISVAGNVVEATHGATIPADEVIASGDASRPAQNAILATKPLTNVLADGVPRPELQVWVRPSAAGDALAATAALAGRKADDESVRWYRVPDFRASKKRSRDYVARQDADGSAVLTFGDGEKARRLPTGVNNVVARYRVGGGPDGNVTPNRLTLFQTPVRGADRVRNPVAAAGGVAAERVADLRRTVSRGLVALDRVVSQQDLEDYVRAWPGVAKVDVVRAAGRGRASFVVTYASRDDDVVDVAALSAALKMYGASAWSIEILPARRRRFSLEASLLVAPPYVAAGVLQDANATVLNAFAFDARDLRQGVKASSVVALLQRVRGVRAVVLDALYEAGTIRRVDDLDGDDGDPGDAASLLTAEAADVRLVLLAGNDAERGE